MSDFRQEVETQETGNQMHRKIWQLEMDLGKENLSLMITFNPYFQMNVEQYTTINLYGEKCTRICLGYPWFSDMGQDEPFIVWKRV